MSMMMKQLTMFLLVAMCLTGSIAAYAQDKEGKQEVVTLKNGHRVRGKIVTYAPLDSLVLQQDDGTLQTIYWNSIKQIVKEDWQPQQAMGSAFTPGVGPKQGYRGFADVEYYTSIDAISEDHFGFSTAHGYQFKPYLFVGVGAGLKISHKKHLKDYNFTPKEDFYMFPVFADVRFDLLKYKFSPFIDCRVGYTLGNKAYGVMFNPSVGCRIAISGKFALNASLGYSMQSTDIHVYSSGSSAIWHYEQGNEQNNPYHCVSFKLGAEF